MTVGNDVSQETVDSAAVFLFNLFIVEPQLTRAHAEEIRRTLGPFPASAAHKVSNTIKKILTYLPPDSPFAYSSSEQTSLTSSEDSTLMRKEFGHNIHFKFDTESIPAIDDDVIVKSKLTTGYDSLSDDETTGVASSNGNIFTQTFLNEMQKSLSKPAVKKMVAKSHPQLAPPPLSPYSGEWLKIKCKECVREGSTQLSWQDLYSAIFEPLSSGQENAAIENDVRLCCSAVHCVL